MAYTTIDDPSAHFQAFTYTGTGVGNRSITLNGNSNLQPDLYWYKGRNSNHHYWVDSSRGTTKYLYSSLANAEGTVAIAYVRSFDTNGVTLGDGDSGTNTNGISFANWVWKANGGTGGRTAFTESGANPGGGYQPNTTAGFSIVDYTGTGSAGTVSHGLGAKPEFIIVKNLDVAEDWAVYHQSNTAAPETDLLELNQTAATADVTVWNDTLPTTSVFSVGTDARVNSDAVDYIAYCFASKQGYSKFGSYVGNGNVDSPFVYTGFKPAFVMMKRAIGGTSSYSSWAILDSKRYPFNNNLAGNKVLWANANYAEGTRGQGGSNDGGAANLDLLSNGFKVRDGGSDEANDLNDTYIYIAFAEQPFVTSSGVPCTAV